MTATQDMTLTEIARRITNRLRRLEADEVWNRVEWTDSSGRPQVNRKLYSAAAFRTGSRVKVTYVSYQGSYTLTRQEAAEYLEWLRAGNRGSHYGMGAS